MPLYRVFTIPSDHLNLVEIIVGIVTGLSLNMTHRNR